jgi:hypothetical protein
MNNFNIFKRMFNNEGGHPNGHGPNNGGASSNHPQESDFEDLYQDMDSNYNYHEFQHNAFNYHGGN